MTVVRTNHLTVGFILTCSKNDHGYLRRNGQATFKVRSNEYLICTIQASFSCKELMHFYVFYLNKMFDESSRKADFKYGQRYKN